MGCLLVVEFFFFFFFFFDEVSRSPSVFFRSGLVRKELMNYGYWFYAMRERGGLVFRERQKLGGGSE